MSASENLLGEFELRQETEDLKGAFDARQSTSTTLKGILIVRHSSTKDLYTKFEIQDSATLKGILIVRHSATKNLFTKLTVRHSATKALFAKFKAAILFSGTPRNLYSKFFRGVDGTANLKAVFIITEEKDLPAEFITRHEATKNLNADFTVKVYFNEGWQGFIAYFLPRRTSTEDLLNELIVRNSGSVELEAASVIRHSASTTLKGSTVIRHSASAGLMNELIVRHSATKELKGSFLPRRTATRDLHARFEPIPNENLYAKLVVRHSATKTLVADFFIRWPYRLWTTRRYINGVVNASEELVGDAKLEDTIEGVMDDIKTFLAANQITTYTQWETIEDTPLAIRRATTYGTVASLYSRHTKSFTSRVIPSVAPVTVTVKGDAREAMEHWESRYELMLERYLAAILTGKLFVSTEDEEPVFTMDDIPETNGTYKSWHEWITS